MYEGILLGLNTVITPANLILVFGGCLAGTLIGMLPGLGPMSAIALMIPITYGFEPASGMILLAGVYYGAIFGGCDQQTSATNNNLLQLELFFLNFGINKNSGE